MSGIFLILYNQLITTVPFDGISFLEIQVESSKCFVHSEGRILNIHITEKTHSQHKIFAVNVYEIG